ncbi:MAG: 1-deoxy-D-xylulose-5-phosphate synthase [Ruminococcaceae bacterium]|nr:1-deoxy-D-xylulose-5-phosphate synthase [Oscillospiraceae bacterium]
MDNNKFELLEKIKSPQDLKKLSVDELPSLCEEIRRKLILTVSENGGHLAPNLGVVELTVAMHYVFDCPEDSIVWDVGHQCYTHKMLTGRYDKISSIRRTGGLSGFPRRYESEYDVFGAGHSSTSISAALGIAKAKQLKGDDSHTVAFIGDGSFTGGLAFEGMNNAGRLRRNFIVILNDNKMSISKNVGAMSRHLTSIRVSNWYLNAKVKLERFFNKIPLVGKPFVNFLTTIKNWFKKKVYKTNMFENFGFHYYGPVDGHNLESLISVLKAAKTVNRPVLIHAVTTKGKGYQFAENDPKSFHGIGRFDIDTGEPLSHSDSYSNCFGETLCSLAEKDEKICAITAAMTTGTGLSDFAERFKDRFFDVGIAEEHAVTFGSGLACQGMTPVFAVYSSFLQRAYDQLVHDAAAQKLHLVLGVDRAGIVGEDGETHQGVFDVSILNTIPSTTIYSPCYFDDLKACINQAVNKESALTAVRYPRGSEPYRPDDFTHNGINFSVYGNPNASRLIVTYGRLFSQACKAKEMLSNVGKETCILKLCRIKPIDPEAIRFAACFKKVHFFEEGMRSGGVAETFESELYKERFEGIFSITAIEDMFIPHSKDTEALHALKLDAEGMFDILRK